MNKEQKKRLLHPPKIAERLLNRILPDYTGFSGLGDYEEIFNRYIQESGLRRARMWYWGQVLKSFIPYLFILTKWRFLMLNNYLKLTWRNILSKKFYSIINITGLAIGITCCILILIWVQDELSYDRFHQHADDLYVATFSNGSITTPPALATTLQKDYPEVLNSCRVLGPWRLKFTYKKRDFFDTGGILADAALFKMFTINFINGNPETVFSDPKSIVISESFAKRHFPDFNPIGETVMINNTTPYKITGIIEDYPTNSHLRFNFVRPFILLREAGQDLNSWQTNWLRTYVHLKQATPVHSIDKKIYDLVTRHRPQDKRTLMLQPITRLHLNPFKHVGTLKYVYIFTALAIFILFIACFNFTNLTTAASMPRAREVGLRRVVGAKKSELRRQFFGETLLMTLIAMILAFLLVIIFLPGFNQLSGKTFEFSRLLSLNSILGILLVVFCTAFIAGGYPALYLSSFHPVNVLRGRMPTLKGGASFRKTLVLCQFIITISLLVGTGIIHQQIDYMRSRPVGYDRKNIIHTYLRSRLSESEVNTLRQHLLQNPNIENVTTTSNAPYHRETDYGKGDIRWEGQQAGQETKLHYMAVDPYYLDTFKMKIKTGRFFSVKRASDKTDAFVLNETAINAMKLKNPIGKRVWIKNYTGIIIGVIKDFHFNSMRSYLEPLAMTVSPSECNELCIRIGSHNIRESVNHIGKVWKNFYPKFPFEYRFLDDILNSLYLSEERIGQTFESFTLLAIFISCLGLLGLAAFTAQQRTKEIGIRKTLGASSWQIITLLSTHYLKWVLAANIIAWPITYLSMNKWLLNFPYRVSVTLPVFILSGGLALLIALLTVSYRAVKASRANPVDSLKQE